MNKTPIVLLGLFDTGLYVAQSVSAYGIPVLGFDYDKGKPGFYSRHIKASLCPHPFTEPEKLLELITGVSEGLGFKPVLVPSSEEYVGFINRNSKELKKHFIFLVPEPGIMDNVLSKQGQFQLAESCKLLVPSYSCIRTTADFEAYLHGYNNKSVIIKAIDQPAWKAKIRKKAYITGNPEELNSIGFSLIQQGITFIIQDIIEGDCTHNYEFNALMINGKIAESCVIQKIRQYPPGYGAASCIQTIDKPEIEELGRRFVLQNNLQGFSNTEFKLNPSDGKLYFIETNARVWQQIRLTESLGQNFVLSYYMFLTSGNSVDSPANTGQKQVRWVDIYSDALLWWRFLRKTGMSAREYLVSIKSAKSYGLLTYKDIRPFLHEFGQMNIFKRKRR